MRRTIVLLALSTAIIIAAARIGSSLALLVALLLFVVIHVIHIYLHPAKAMNRPGFIGG